MELFNGVSSGFWAKQVNEWSPWSQEDCTGGEGCYLVLLGRGGRSYIALQHWRADGGDLLRGVRLGGAGGCGLSGPDHLVLMGSGAVDELRARGARLAVLGAGNHLGDAVAGLEVADVHGLGVALCSGTGVG